MSHRRIGVLLATLALAAPLSVLIGAPALAQLDHGSGKGSSQASDHGSGKGHGHSKGDRGASRDAKRDGSPSRNGNGGGKAVGKPCAGCVGNADDKKPPGQARKGDRNAGYECDRNHGIGRGNPAHSGCAQAPSESPPPDKAPGGKSA